MTFPLTVNCQLVDGRFVQKPIFTCFLFFFLPHFVHTIQFLLEGNFFFSLLLLLYFCLSVSSTTISCSVLIFLAFTLSFVHRTWFSNDSNLITIDYFLHYFFFLPVAKRRSLSSSFSSFNLVFRFESIFFSFIHSEYRKILKWQYCDICIYFGFFFFVKFIYSFTRRFPSRAKRYTCSCWRNSITWMWSTTRQSGTVTSLEKGQFLSYSSIEFQFIFISIKRKSPI